MRHPRLARLAPRLVPVAATLVMLTATGCPWPWGPGPSGSPIPTSAPSVPITSPSPAPGLTREVFVSGTANVNGILTIRPVRAGSTETLAGCTISLAGPTPAWGVTNATQEMRFDPLEAGTYTVRVQAPGYATRVIEGVTINPSAPAALTVELTPQAGKAVGRVLNQSGQAIAGARVSSGGSIAFTGADGSYALEGLNPGANTLTIAKTGFATATANLTIDGQDVPVGDTSLASQGLVVAFENPSQTFDVVSGGATRSVAAALAPLRTALGVAGFTIQDDATAPAIRVVVCPTEAFASPATVDRLKAFVAAGGKLVLLGEWGGALRYNPEALNRIATPFGLAFHPDLVRSAQNAGQPGWVRVAGLSGAMPADVAMPQGITLFESSSLFVPPPAQGVAYAGAAGYRVAALGADGPCMAVGRSYGAGMVVGVGDTSAWTAGSITGNLHDNGNLGETNNREFVLNLFRW